VSRAKSPPQLLASSEFALSDGLISCFVTAVSLFVVGAVVQWWASRGAPAATWPQRAPVMAGGGVETHAWSRYHARYFPMTLVFIAFEMEMMFMYPWAVVFVREGGRALVEMAMFLGLLSVGIVYAWREGAFRWQ
jgi:NADH:ubiquinone oxidoreductase subunit 3 (subunit A)